MKKLSLILALVLVLTCGVLAACGDETETSSATDVESSEAKNESSAAAESSEATEESSEAAAESSDVEESSVPVVEAGENVAAGKTYERSLLYRQGDATNEWGWTPENDIAYPDTDAKEMTDGTIAATDSGMDSAEWMGFHAKAPDYTENGYSYITLDLGETYDLVKLVTYVGSSKLGGGILAPTGVSFYVSEDGETWTEAATATPADTSDVSVIEVAVNVAVSGRYVQYRYTSGSWMFVSEVEAYTAAE